MLVSTCHCPNRSLGYIFSVLPFELSCNCRPSSEGEEAIEEDEKKNEAMAGAGGLSVAGTG